MPSILVLQTNRDRKRSRKQHLGVDDETEGDDSMVIEAEVEMESNDRGCRQLEESEAYSPLTTSKPPVLQNQSGSLIKEANPLLLMVGEILLIFY